MKDLLVLVGAKLSVKLSFLNGSLKGTETYAGLPDDETYWRKYYNMVPRKITVVGNVGIKTPNGWFLFWQNGQIDATEMVGKEADYMPDTLLTYKDLTKLEDIQAPATVDTPVIDTTDTPSEDTEEP
jgi:hypothetical protein